MQKRKMDVRNHLELHALACTGSQGIKCYDMSDSPSRNARYIVAT